MTRFCHGDTGGSTLFLPETGLGLCAHLGADLDEADVGDAARAALLGLVDAAGAVPAVEVAAVGHVVLGLGRLGPLIAAVAVDPEQRHDGEEGPFRSALPARWTS